MVTFDILVEICKGSNMKYEYDKQSRRIRLDRILSGSNVYPGDYGLIEQTLELDGDALDVLILISQPTFPGCVVEVKIIGGLEMIDEGKMDNKIIGVCTSDPEWSHINSINEVPLKIKAKIYDFFLNYKNLEKKQVKLNEWFDEEKALQIIREAQTRFQKEVTN